MADGELQARKVAGETNPADLLTKGLARELLQRHTAFACCEVRSAVGASPSTPPTEQAPARPGGASLQALFVVLLENLVAKEYSFLASKGKTGGKKGKG